MPDDACEVGIIGGGPAGLSAALLLGRARRRVIVFDSGQYRNARSRLVHGFMTREATPPAELRRLAHDELRGYPNVELRAVEVLDARREADDFILVGADGATVRCRAIVLATGLTDQLPTFAGAAELHGDRVFPCPYCDGWEHRDQPLAAYSHPDDRGGTFALALSQWSRDLVLVSSEPPKLSRELAAKLAARGIAVEPRPVVRAVADGDGVSLELAGGGTLWRRAVFYHLGCGRRTELAEKLGCTIDDRGSIEVDRVQFTGVPGIYVAGDASRDVLQAIVAAGEGAAAGVKINEWLSERDRS